MEESSYQAVDVPETLKNSQAARDNSPPTAAVRSEGQKSNITEQLPSSIQGATRREPFESAEIKHDFPWKTYKKGYELELDKIVIVATRKAFPFGRVAIRDAAGRDASAQLELLHRIQHEKFVPLLEIFEYGKTFYFVFQHIFVSLREVVDCPAFPTERQLAAAIGQVWIIQGPSFHATAGAFQVLEGLIYLATKGLQHGSLTCSSVLLKSDGEIKLAHQEYCCKADRSGTTDVRAVGYIMMELIQKYAKDDGAIGIENLHRWSVDSDAVKFLSMTTSASSVEELMKHAFLKKMWWREDLELLVELAAAAVHRAYTYHE